MRLEAFSFDINSILCHHEPVVDTKIPINDVSESTEAHESVSERENSRLSVAEEIPLESTEEVQYPVAPEKPIPKMPQGIGVEFGNFARTNEQGLIEIIDIETGTIIAAQASPYDMFKQRSERLVEVEMPDGSKAWLEKGLPLNAVTRVGKQPYQYTELWGDLITQEIAAGATIKELSKRSGFPPLSIIQKWKRDNPNFREKVKLAEISRAEMYHDEIVELAKNTEIESKQRRSQVDAFKWAAEKNDPEKFGPKVKVSGDPNAPLGFIIDTGIRRATDEGYKADPIDVTPKVEGKNEKS